MKNKDLHHKAIDSIIQDKNNAAHDELARQYASIWEGSKDIPYPDFDPEKAIKRVDIRLNNHSSHKRISIATWFKVAAFLVFAAISLVLLKKYTGNHQENEVVEIFVKNGERLQIRLPDGNQVWLNSNTTLRYPANFTGLNKKLEITGEAYFDLKNQGNFPLIICANNNLINCTDAVFNIKASTHGTVSTEIVVEKGSIAVSNSKIPGNIEVASGNKVSLTDQLPLVMEPEYSPNELAWKTRQLVFEKTPVQTVASVLSGYYHVNVRVEGEVRFCKFSSTYEDKDISVILNDIQKQYNPAIIRHANEIVISGRDCNENL